MSVSSRIVQRGVATVREVEEALARQVLYGGDLVTNLLEVCRIDEKELMPIVAEALGLPNAPIGELPRASSEAQRMVAPEVALERAMAPLAMDQEGLVVAVAEPLSNDDEQELAFALAVPIAQQIAPLVRIRQALQRDYGVPLDRRLERLLQRISDGGPRTKSSFPPARSTAPKPPPRPPTNVPPPVTRVVEEKPRSIGTPPTLLRAIEAPPSRPTKRRRGPLTMDVAQHELESAAERDTIFDLLFEFSRQFFDYTALFLIKDDVAEGRDAFGEGAPRDLIGRIGVPLDMPSLLAKAKNDRKLVRGRGDASGVDGVLAKDLGRPGETEWVVVPVVVRGRVVSLLLGDGGDGGIDDAGLADVEEIAKSSVGAFERVIVRKKLKGSTPPKEGVQPSTPPSQVPATQLSAEAKRPSVEELAAPIRELVAETEGKPSSLPKETAREPTPEIKKAGSSLPLSMTPSERPIAPKSAPPPANILSVRRPSGAPIPREEPPSVEMAAVSPPALSPLVPLAPLAPPPAPVSAAPAPSKGAPPRSKSSGNIRRAVAPPLEFGSMPPSPPAPMFAEDASEVRLLAEIQGTPAPPATKSSRPPRATSQRPKAPDMPASVHTSGREDTSTLTTDPPRTPPSEPGLPVLKRSPSSSSMGAIGRRRSSAPAMGAIAPPAVSISASTAPATTRDLVPPAVTEPPPALSEAPTSPKAESPPPPRPSSITDPSPVSPFIPAPSRTLEIVDDDPSATPLPIDLTGSDATPAAPAVAPTGATPVRVTSTLTASPVSPPKPMPQSEQQISVAPHRPPSSRRDSARGLPSVIVDTTSEFVAYVKRVLAGDDDEAESQLLRAGGAAMPAIMEQFPGPITVDEPSLEGSLPRVADCGPILRLVATQRRTAVPYVLSLVDNDDAHKRFWATYLLTELVYPDAIDAAVRRVFDDEARIRRVARAAARALAEAHPSAVVDRLAPTLQDKLGKKDHRMLAIDTLGETREPLAVLALVPVLGDKSSEIATAARAALTTITRQDFGTDSKKWEAWWQQNKDRHRLEWLMDALTHEQASLRAAAGEELKTITKEFFGYHNDLPKKEREKAQARYREWWSQVGRVRFNRASSRGS